MGKAFVFYTNFFVLPNSTATTYGPFIFIRPRAKGDVGMLEHEKVHVNQFYRNPFYFIPYFFSRKARMAYEVEAYREQLKYVPERRENLARALAENYNLGITYEEALQALS